MVPTKFTTKIIKNLVKIWNFKGCFYGNVCFNAKNEGLHVNSRSFEKIGKYNVSKNDEKWGKNEQKLRKMRAFLSKNCKKL